MFCGRRVDREWGEFLQKCMAFILLFIKRTIPFAWVVRLWVIGGLAYGELGNRKKFVLLKIKVYTYYFIKLN
jgi:hypothetical protein